jgi:hypothetical protein
MLPLRAWFRLSTVALAVGALRATKHITPGRLTHWWDPLGTQPQLAELQALLADISSGTGRRTPLKGQPDVAAIKRDFAREVAADLDRGGPQQALPSAHRLAAMDMRDSAAFRLYLGLVCLANAAVFSQLRSALSPQVVMHLSCSSRVPRAQESCQSFSAAESHGVTQVIVVGSATAHCFSYQPPTRVLTVPAPDTYEHLTAKVVAAMCCFSLLGSIEAVLKVDDDHRLRQLDELLRAFRRVRSAAAVQMGRRTNIGVLGQHVRVWHFGKTADPSLNDLPFSLPGTTRWLNGASGYFLNQQALRLLLWSHVYFPEYIRIGLYEDMTISDLIERQGGRLQSTDMQRVLATVDHY